MARALTSHRRLRSPAARVGRSLTGAAAAATGLPLARHTLSVQSRLPVPARELEPVSCMEAVLGAPLLAVVGVRDGANGKATLQLFDHDGSARGYAKVAWSPLTDEYVRTEADVLRSAPQLPAGVRTPRLLADGAIGSGRPFLVTAPLPQSARTLVRGDDLPLGTLISLFPTTRHASVRETGQFLAVLRRLGAAQASSVSDVELHSAATDLAQRLERVDRRLPVLDRWHGDLVPWNAARDDDGTVWLWDWESSEPDTVAGLDILHWLLNTEARQAVGGEPGGLRVAADRATVPLQALGLGPEGRAVVAALYSLSKAERYWTLAAAHGTWERNRVDRATTLRILGAGRSFLAAG